MNRLVLTDEDEAEYAPFQSAIATMPEFSKSNVMLCTFHGIWQSFKKDLYPILAKNANGQLLGMYVTQPIHCTYLFKFGTFKYMYFVVYSNSMHLNSYVLGGCSGVVIQGLHEPSVCL